MLQLRPNGSARVANPRGGTTEEARFVERGAWDCLRGICGSSGAKSSNVAVEVMPGNARPSAGAGLFIPEDSEMFVPASAYEKRQYLHRCGPYPD